MSSEAMDIDHPPLPSSLPKSSHSQTLTTLTISSPPFSYAHLSTTAALPGQELDMIEVRSYLTAALRQFLGDTGVAIPIDILKVQETSVWVRLPRQDLGAFAGAITAFPGITQNESLLLLQLKACGDYLSSLLGRGEGEADIWKP
ncbi:hypothetical protein QBC42DRAFT_272931 [Cladorrhinum samala]|uniref:Ribonucleases P/MRP subunit Pop8-like domain-containing protein n=1 Tax=Cladorrhinum samala TaxID=585594 RepID=A0AAV9HMD2_9PEZI|nr:hypothetical protein QBC42DRAFT_272931 [Cladorrhinum samala]